MLKQMLASHINVMLISPRRWGKSSLVKKALGELVQDSLSEENNTGIQVYIGNETPVSSMKDCSVVTATYELGEGMRGTIGIIGPKRMDYDKVIGTLKTLMNELDTLYKK